MHKFFVALLLALGPSLMAQGVRVNGSVEAGLALPTGVFATTETPSGDHLGANGGLGAQVGGHLNFNLNAHHEVRFHVTIQAFVDGTEDRDTSYHGSGSWNDWDDDWDDWSHRSSTDSENAVKNAFGILQFGCDYVYNFESPSKGPYLLVGAHLNSLSKTTTLPNSHEFTFSQSGRVGYRAGVGYSFNRFISLECHYNTLRVESGGADGFGFDALSWVSATAAFRFGRN